MFENLELERLVKDAGPFIGSYPPDENEIRNVITRVLELARDAQCGGCNHGIEAHLTNEYAWVHNDDDICNAAAIRDLMKVKP